MSTFLVAKSFAPRALRHGRCVATLKEELTSVIPAKRDLLKRIKTQVADDTIGELHVAQAIGGMRGVKSLVWEGSELHADHGIRFHGKSIAECQAMLPKAADGGEMLPESMFWFVLTGRVPGPESIRQLSAELASKAALPDYIFKVLADLPEGTHPMTQFVVAVAALNKESTFAQAYERGVPKSDYWQYVYDDAITLMAKLPAIAAQIYQNSFKNGGAVPGTIDPNADWSLNYARLMGMENQQGFVDLLRLYFALHGDHEGGNVSAHTTHLVGSALSDPMLSYSAGLAGLAGPLHGLAAQEVLRFILDMKASIPENYTKDDVRKFLWDTLNSGRVIPGYGHAVLRKPDPRFAALMRFAQHHEDILRDPVFQLVKANSEIAPSVLMEHGKTKNPFPNVDSSSGVLFHHYGITETKYYTVTFGVSRAIGPLAQLIWDRVLGFPIERPKSMTLKHMAKACGL